jgi:light-regulated signal transduction histidine kinase (bacteriophytochrome)
VTSQEQDQLARANAELEQFAYVASHDLAAPLRTVDGFSRLLAQRYAGRLDAEADEFIEFILGGVAQMQALLQDLLTYSRVSRVGYTFETLDASRIAAEAAAAAGGGTAVRVAALPVVTADATQLRQVFQNLLGNALKFLPADRLPRVVVSGVEDPDGWHFTIADNGIGIPEADRERIFSLFRRLHGPDEYPGSGIGLSICQRVVERHGGRIWVESTIGEGSTFHFTIGRSPEAT